MVLHRYSLKNFTKKDLPSRIFIGTDDDAYHQDQYLESITRDVRAISTIINEYELFGFDDFTPVKEKKETKWGVGLSPNKTFFERKKSK